MHNNQPTVSPKTKVLRKVLDTAVVSGVILWMIWLLLGLVGAATITLHKLELVMMVISCVTGLNLIFKR